MSWELRTARSYLWKRGNTYGHVLTHSRWARGIHEDPEEKRVLGRGGLAASVHGLEIGRVVAAVTYDRKNVSISFVRAKRWLLTDTVENCCWRPEIQ